MHIVFVLVIILCHVFVMKLTKREHPSAPRKIKLTMPHHRDMAPDKPADFKEQTQETFRVEM